MVGDEAGVGVGAGVQAGSGAGVGAGLGRAGLVTAEDWAEPGRIPVMSLLFFHSWN